MSSILHKFQNIIYTLISSNNLIQEDNITVTIFAGSSNKYPHILISDYKVSTLSLHSTNQHNIEFVIYIFGKNNDLGQLMQLSQHLVDLINTDNFTSPDFTVINLTACGVVQDQAHDLTTTRLAIHYRAIIR